MSRQSTLEQNSRKDDEEALCSEKVAATRVQSPVTSSAEPTFVTSSRVEQFAGIIPRGPTTLANSFSTEVILSPTVETNTSNGRCRRRRGRR